MLTRLAWFAALAAVLAGCGEPAADVPGPPLPPEAPLGREAVPPYWSLSLDYVLPAGAELDWSWTNGAGLPVPFRVVRSDANGTRVLYATTAAESSGSLVTGGGAHSLVWTNEGFETLDLSFAVPEGYLAERWPPGRGGCLAAASQRGDGCLLPLGPSS